jgi:hypothetical protein
MSSCLGGPPGLVGAVEAACVSINIMGRYSPLTCESNAELFSVISILSSSHEQQSLPVVDFQHILHDADDQMLHKEIAMFRFSYPIINPFHPLSYSILIQA